MRIQRDVRRESYWIERLRLLGDGEFHLARSTTLSYAMLPMRNHERWEHLSSEREELMGRCMMGRQG